MIYLSCKEWRENLEKSLTYYKTSGENNPLLKKNHLNSGLKRLSGCIANCLFFLYVCFSSMCVQTAI